LPSVWIYAVQKIGRAVRQGYPFFGLWVVQKGGLTGITRKTKGLIRAERRNFLEGIKLTDTRLHPDHLADLRKSGLSDEMIETAGIYSVPPGDTDMVLGRNAPGTSLLAFPYPGADFIRYKLFPPVQNKEGKRQKYHQPPGSGLALYKPPGFDPNGEVFLITEGEKKALKACQDGLNCLGLSGLWNWKVKGEEALIADFDVFNFKEKHVYLVPDNDWQAPNKNLEQAVYRLAYLLVERGATVNVIQLPESTEKIGLDDYLIEHSVAEFQALPTRQIRKLTLEEAVAEATLDSLDGVLERVAKIPSSAKQEVLIAELSKNLGVSKTALKKDLKRHGAKLEDQADKAGLRMTALFPELVDLVEDDGKAVYLIKDAAGLRVETVVDIDGVQHVPPDKTDLPFLLPRAKQCLACYQTDDGTLFNDLLAYFRRFSFLPADRLPIIGLSVLATYLQDHPDIHYQAMILFHAVPERGKSRTGKAMVNVAYRGIHLVDMRESNIFRYSGNLGATIFFDIMDLWKKADRNGSEDVLLLRYEKGATVSRVLYPEKGAFLDMVHYPIGGPTIMASNMEVHKILGSRCLTFSMPNAPGNYENPSPALGLELKERLVAWRAKMMGESLLDIQPIDGISGRLWDITKPLFQICRVVCPELYDALKDALLDVASERTQEKKESFDGLLVSVIVEMTQGDADHFDIATADVTTRFNELWKGDKSKTTAWIGRRLKALGIPTDTRNRFSTIRLDRELLNTILSQYGFTTVEISSNTSNTLQDTENINTSPFEDISKDNVIPKNLEKTSNTVLAINSDSCRDVEDIEDIQGVFTKVAEQKNLLAVQEREGPNCVEF